MVERTLYYLPLSHWCVAAERMFSFKELPFRKALVPYHDKRALIRATGQDYVPAVREDGRVVPWKEIPEYLEAAAPRPTLFPRGTRGLTRALATWAHGAVEECVWRVVLPRVPPTFSDEHERWVFEEMQARSRGPIELLAARGEEFRGDLDEQLASAESMLENGDWLLGEPSRSDFALFGALSPLTLVGEPIPERFPRLGRWHRRVAAIPSSEVEGRIPAGAPAGERRARRPAGANSRVPKPNSL